MHVCCIKHAAADLDAADLNAGIHVWHNGSRAGRSTHASAPLGISTIQGPVRQLAVALLHAAATMWQTWMQAGRLWHTGINVWPHFVACMHGTARHLLILLSAFLSS
jgi:hypothetical protein